MEEAQCELSAAVADADEQVAPAAIRDLGQQYFAADQAAVSRFERADAHELRAVFVAQRQQEQQVLDDMQPELLQLFSEGRTDAFEACQVIR